MMWYLVFVNSTIFCGLDLTIHRDSVVYVVTNIYRALK
jgi:hypothetical protein